MIITYLNSGKYIKYDNNNIIMSILIRYFSADWCGPCKTQSPIIDELKEDYEEDDEVNIEKADVDKQQDLANKYSVRSIPTIVVIEEDNEGSETIDNRFVGVTQKDILEEAIEDLK